MLTLQADNSWNKTTWETAEQVVTLIYINNTHKLKITKGNMTFSATVFRHQLTLISIIGETDFNKS